ncbi:nuclear transport factor 2 family protein [Dyella sp. BiH032]|uniref:nuclear transport factor 2 family protein n=1 Tax=Dyella sp. BiH032 TaxID=3075430 RepID=UPI002892BB2C|nr:nuclear transport factor 2 family protein [Dyella sp. BiH032]WNL46340.1 nuclear transport factor 2 family protein [Dyella sp. BiH032]
MRALVDNYLAAYNRMDVSAMLRTMHREVVFENYTKGVLSVRTQGADELRHLAESSLHLFSARRQLITAFREHGGDAATADILFDGTFAIDLPNGVRAGQSIALTGRSEYRARDGLLVYIADFSE